MTHWLDSGTLDASAPSLRPQPLSCRGPSVSHLYLRYCKTPAPITKAGRSRIAGIGFGIQMTTRNLNLSGTKRRREGRRGKTTGTRQRLTE